MAFQMSLAVYVHSVGSLFLTICLSLLVNFYHSWRSKGKQHFGKSGKIDVTFEDHPLNPNPDSQWVAYFKDNDVLVQIDKDVRRLCPDIGFFQRATEFPCQDVVNAAEMETLRKRVDCSVLQSHTVMKNRQGAYNWKSSKKSTVEYDLLPDGKEAHWEVVERILFIYAKLNPGLAYVQGMNEIIGPIYYIFASDSEREWSEHAECDAFFCFTNLMSEIRDNFIKSLDDSAHGIGNMMMQLMNRLQLHDPDVGSLMVTQDLKPQYFSFRWLTLLLSQEFPMPDVIRVWDSLFADSKRFDFLIDVCLAMLLLIRDDLLKNDFSSNMKLLQRYPVFDIHLVLSEAVRLQKS
ncbi:PREDICTED: TBC1 domain family member 13-like isoform X2 [Priapulus caudatus]|uniref:TBC1 domain family member 13-like isoform X2 n=1 Tax=Priapulus caudatus TaxID=37621 RepID=A0ABM1ECE4_PRICU|nr:PREDICTED: TBC1 domain family member 13-like isoform X2 [Priapulus caudatus]XP_014669866.1 PREDICTED: TBC1 domain family member 13-like isoform X2 [Priapulus caudatus]